MTIVADSRTTEPRATTTTTTTTTTAREENPHPPLRRRRKLRVLVVTLGGPRQEAITAMFQHPTLAADFAAPVFSPGIPARSLRARRDFLRLLHSDDLDWIPSHEWAALETALDDPHYQHHPEAFWECLQNVAVQPRTASHQTFQEPTQPHYSAELWHKVKSLNRGRNVLACVLAHLRAMKRLVEEDFDVIVEDNVRMPIVLDGTVAESLWKMREERTPEVDLEYYGWLGSLPNLEWMITIHRHRAKPSETAATFDFPFSRDVTEDDIARLREQRQPPNHTPAMDQDPGGTALLWGAYAYWISPRAYHALRSRLKDDIGALLWKSKKMRHYQVKPIDKILPRIISELGDTTQPGLRNQPPTDQSEKNTICSKRNCSNIRVAQTPVFFRAPMLSSNIHAQWDPGFCQSTLYQLQHANGWSFDDLWLTEEEQSVVRQYNRTGEWKSAPKMST